MYGAIIGDLAGSKYEFDQTKEIKNIKINNLIDKESFYSDDTILTIAIIDAILNDRNYTKYLKYYINKYKDYHPNYKPYFKNAFSPNLLSWANNNQIGRSSGNGALMRISGVGYLFNDEFSVINNSILSTLPSHFSYEALYDSCIISLMIYLFRKGLTKDEVFEKLGIEVKYSPFTKFNKTCEETIDNCLYVVYNSNSFEESIEKIIYEGGDTDTNAAIVGSITESIYGISDSLIKDVNKKIPDEFVYILNKVR